MLVSCLMLAGSLQAATTDAVLVLSNQLESKAKESVVESFFAGKLESDPDCVVKEVPSGLALVHCSAWEGPQLRALTSIIAKMADCGDEYNCIDTSTLAPDERVFAKRWMAQAATPEVASTIAQDEFKFWFTCDAVMRFEKDGKAYTARLPDNPKEMKPLYNPIGKKPPLSKEEMAAQAGFVYSGKCEVYTPQRARVLSAAIRNRIAAETFRTLAVEVEDAEAKYMAALSALLAKRMEAMGFDHLKNPAPYDSLDPTLQKRVLQPTAQISPSVPLGMRTSSDFWKGVTVLGLSAKPTFAIATLKEEGTVNGSSFQRGNLCSIDLPGR